MTTEEPGRRAAERAAGAGRRTEEISRGLVRLATGSRPDVDGVRRAEEQPAEHRRAAQRELGARHEPG